jgi:hypothetical protein
VLLELNIDPLVHLDVHEMNRRPSFPDHLQVGPVLRVIEASQLAIVNAETIGPNVQDALLYRAVVGCGRNGTAAGVGDRTALDAVAAQGLACTTETSPRGPGGLFGLPVLPSASVEGQS